MPKHAFPSLLLLWAAWSAAASSVALIAVGCSSAPTPSTSCTSGTTVACACPNGQAGTQACGTPTCSCAATETGADSVDADVPGDATHRDEQPAPVATYGARAQQGSFGWPCTSATSGLDPAECTDPSFPYCFAGAQGGRCTALCGDDDASTCPLFGTDAGDAGCVPTDCNARGYCK